MEWDGAVRNGRGIDTFGRLPHFLGVNRNYTIYIIPIYSLKLASPFQAVDAPTFQIFPRGGGGKEREWMEGDWVGRNGRGVDTFER